MREQPAVTPRFDGVDVLRGFSILSVVLLHTWIRMHFPGSTVNQVMRGWLAHLLLRNGDNGVTVFFAVSGFLITLTSLRRFGSLAEMRPARFYRIRFARIAPLLILLLAVLSLLHLAHFEGFRIPAKTTTLTRALFAALAFHLNWLEAVHGYLPANWDVLWSLSDDEGDRVSGRICWRDDCALGRSRYNNGGSGMIGSGGPEMHEVWTDVILVAGGQAMMVYQTHDSWRGVGDDALHQGEAGAHVALVFGDSSAVGSVGVGRREVFL